MSKADWRLRYMRRLMTEHGATKRDAQEHFADVRELYGIEYGADPERQADEEAKLFGFAWNEWTPTKQENAVMPLKWAPSKAYAA